MIYIPTFKVKNINIYLTKDWLMEADIFKALHFNNEDQCKEILNLETFFDSVITDRTITLFEDEEYVFLKTAKGIIE